MDPSLSVWVIDYDPSAAPGLPAVLGERSRVDPAGTIYFKVGPLDTDWSLTPGGGVGIVTSVTATLPVTSTGGTTPVIALNYDNTTLTLAAATTLQRAALSGDISAPAGSNTTTLATVNANVGSFTYASITVNGKGLITAAASGTAPAPSNATYITQTPDATLSAEQALSLLATGVMQVTTATGVIDSFAVGTDLVPYGAASKLATTSTFGFNSSNGTLAVGVAPASARAIARIHAYGTVAGGVNTVIENTSANPLAFASTVFFSDTGRGDVYFTNSNYASGDSAPNSLTFGCTASVIFSPGYVRQLTLNSTTANFESGTITMADLNAGGVVYATAATGVLKIGTSGEVAGAITWPAQGLVLISDGVNDAPVGIAGFNYDGTNDLVEISDDIGLAHYNLGSAGTGTYERVTATWLTNEWVLSSESAGGTVRNMIIQSDTATLTLSGGGGAYLVGGAVASAPYVLANSLAITVASPASRASSAGATLNAISVLGSTVSVTGNTNITTAAGFNYINVAAPTFSGSGGAKTITTASTMVIVGPPAAAGDVTITLPMTFWVQAGRSRFDGHFTGAGAGSNLGFFGFNGVGITNVTGAKGGNAALASLLAALVGYNLITDGTSA